MWTLETFCRFSLPKFIAIDQYLFNLFENIIGVWFLNHGVVMGWAFLPSVLWRCWLGGRKGIKNWIVGCWHGYLSVANCSWCQCHSLSLAPVNPDWFWYQLTQVVPDKVQRAVNHCVCVVEMLRIYCGVGGPVIRQFVAPNPHCLEMLWNRWSLRSMYWFGVGGWVLWCVERCGRVPSVRSNGARQLGHGVLVVQVERRHRRPWTHLPTGRWTHHRPTSYRGTGQISRVCRGLAHPKRNFSWV